jgi:hypothetical protein
MADSQGKIMGWPYSEYEIAKHTLAKQATS